MMTTTILSRDRIAAWRKSVADSNGTVAAVAGSFAMLQPGNIRAVRIAKENASHVCVLIEPAIGRADPGRARAVLKEQAILTASLKNVSAAFESPERAEDLDKLRPFIMVDCLAQPAPSRLRLAARSAADTIVDIPAIPGCFTADILEAIRNGTTPIAVPESGASRVSGRIEQVVEALRAKGRKLVTVNGCFDILHPGHTQMLSEARLMGDELIVLVNDDSSVRAYKGGGRPVFPVHFRLEALRSLTPVSLAYPFSGDNPLALLSRIRPDIHVKGGSYERDRVRDESDLLRTWGGRLEFCEMVEGYSTTRLIQTAPSYPSG